MSCEARISFVSSADASNARHSERTRVLSQSNRIAVIGCEEGYSMVSLLRMGHIIVSLLGYEKRKVGYEKR